MPRQCCQAQGLTDQEIKELILSEEDKSLDDTVKAMEDCEKSRK